MIEVEAKIKVSNVKELNNYRIIIKKIGKFRGKVKKIDDYYTTESLRSYPKKSLRVRKIDGYYIINFKQRVSYKEGIHAKKETEFKVSDIKGFLALIDDFGYRKWLRKEKLTELYEIEKNLHVEINNVKNLGHFIEVEYLSEEGEISKARKAVLAVLKELGVRNKDIVEDGYTKILWNKGFVEK